MSTSDLSSNICQYCRQYFSRKDALVRHIEKKRCKWLKIESEDTPVLSTKFNDMNKKIVLKEDLEKVEPFPKLEKKMKELEEQFNKQIEQLQSKTNEEIAKLKEKPNNIINNNLQIVCVGNNDNYLDMLTDQLHSFDKALEYIKDCALSQLSGDCKLIEKIYLSNEHKNIRYTDKSRTKIEYLNENQDIVRDTKELFGKKIANNLQNSYLKGVNYLLNNALNSRLCPNKFLEEYDIQMWNQHIYDLCDHQYQKKIVNHLDIPQA